MRQVLCGRARRRRTGSPRAAEPRRGRATLGSTRRVHGRPPAWDRPRASRPTASARRGASRAPRSCVGRAAPAQDQERSSARRPTSRTTRSSCSPGAEEGHVGERDRGLASELGVADAGPRCPATCRTPGSTRRADGGCAASPPAPRAWAGSSRRWLAACPWPLGHPGAARGRGEVPVPSADEPSAAAAGAVAARDSGRGTSPRSGRRAGRRVEEQRAARWRRHERALAARLT